VDRDPIDYEHHAYPLMKRFAGLLALLVNAASTRHSYYRDLRDSRIIGIDGDNVTFRWKERANGDEKRTDTISGVGFVRRTLRHVLPRGMRAIRYDGFCHFGMGHGVSCPRHGNFADFTSPIAQKCHVSPYVSFKPGDIALHGRLAASAQLPLRACSTMGAVEISATLRFRYTLYCSIFLFWLHQQRHLCVSSIVIY
jgi:hypothetical protein